MNSCSCVNFKIIDNLSPFEQKIFESLTIQLSYNDKLILLTSAYLPTEFIQI